MHMYTNIHTTHKGIHTLVKSPMTSPTVLVDQLLGIASLELFSSAPWRFPSNLINTLMLMMVWKKRIRMRECRRVFAALEFVYGYF